MASKITSAEQAVKYSPFSVEISPNGYVVKDNDGYVWATCRNEENALLIKDGLHALAREWKP